MIRPKITSISVQRFKKDTEVEYFHTFTDEAGKNQTIQREMLDWYNPFKTSFEEEKRLYHITLKSPLTEDITLTDGNRDGIITGIKAITNSYLKSLDPIKVSAAKVVMLGLNSIKHSQTEQYITQTGQIDNLLNYLMIQEPESVSTLGLTVQVEELKVLNDHMHELIAGRVDERLDKDLGAFEKARRKAEDTYRDFIEYLNAWALVNLAKLGDEARDLATFIDWANALIL